ncbi:four helix bundle protein [Rhodohalobacter mucosus]|uniref:Four helix bundle protein n=1 Tax=Rhodohalobacter mucosus TaxID=2079485 RepID=A0A316TX04_9BACT|nr:four helix bundle protein [Rhodohalobacter mucosus]PWN07939.1 four helix bundle protein [Rhodohalobacter mucosus]
MSYKNLEIWNDARSLSIDIHALTLLLPKFELYETGSQIRRSSKSVRSNIVEGYARRKYTNDYTRFLIYSHASLDETRDHLEILWETGSLKDGDIYIELLQRIDKLGSKIYRFIKAIEKRN